MGTSKKQVEANREAILIAAERLFRERGVDAVGIVELMEGAGLTRGGFYNHFASKGALVEEVLSKALSTAESDLAVALDASAKKGREPVEDRLDWYLSKQHRADVSDGCPVAGFAVDVRRLEDGSRTHFADAVETYVELIAHTLPEGDARQRRGRAIGTVATMVGALLLSRAVTDVAPELADEILAQGKRAAKNA